MNNKLLEFRDIADKVFKNEGKFLNFTSSDEDKKKAIESLNDLKEKAEEEKYNAIKISDNDLANGFASFELVIESMKSEYKMWLSLNEKDYNKAWDFLVDAQDFAILSMQAHNVNGHLDKYNQRLLIIEKLLFPPQLFFSDRTIVSKSSCTICNKDMQECEHIKGKFYMGIQCCERVEKIESIEGIDIVKEPANKKCRAIF
ncbi:hypothetical protein [Winogradskyella marincola]|uniref:Uncharacterized protein n=1 Tax=Winogradskyella marincola TaxID=3037795 RepID=A0ABT6G4D2_9FLAO|nr:hypothetical protein [Winogradskyella sp. YYF002]MDG4716684.1 hypothetical protein [Winogradskyella sp. YYF002]